VPLERVLIVDESSGRSILTDAHGRFELRDLPPGTRRLFVSVVGYALVQRDVAVTAGAVLDLTIPMSEGTGSYTSSVTVRPDLFRVADPTVASQQTLGSAELQNLRGVLADDPLRAVQVLPGVATGDDLRSEFSVRGNGFTHMNLTVEGFSTPYLLHTVRAVEDGSSSGSVAMINSDIIDEVTLLNGGYAQRFGNRIGAEVDFRLRDGSRDRTQLHAAVSGTNASVVGEGPLGRGRRGSWLASVRQSYLDFIVHKLSDDALDFGFSDAQAKLAFDVATAQRVELALIAGRSRAEQISADGDLIDPFVGRNRSVIAIGSWRRTTPRSLVTARALAALNDFRNDITNEVNLDRGRDTQAGGRVDVTLSATAALQIETGASSEWTDETRKRQRFSSALNRYRDINDYHGNATQTGAYAQLRWTAGPLTIVPGARADRWSLTGETTASPWLQAEWKASRSIALRGGAGVYRQFPGFEQVIGALGRADAVAERATHFDLGLEQRLGASGRWQVTLYDRQEQGIFRRAGADTRLIDGRVVRGAATAVYGATLEGYARGVEWLVQRKSANGFTGWASYALGFNRYHDGATGESFWGDLDQRHTINLYVGYRLSDRANVSAKLRVGSNVPAPGYFAKQDDVFSLAAERNHVRLPTYARLDLRANRTYNWSGRRLTLFAELLNTLNRGNYRFSPPSVNSRTGQVTGLFETLIPILPSVGILIEF
jgi:hypothetical protein